MSEWPLQNPRFSDDINNPPGSALAEFGRLLAGLALVFTLATLVLIAVAGRLSPLIPFSWEVRLTEGLSLNEADEAATSALEALGAALALHADLDPEIELHFHLLDKSTPNAFATLGGHIMVTRGLINAVESENGLAMVLAHEIAHIQQRDPIRQLGRGAVLSLAWALVTGSTGQVGLERVLGTGGMLAMLHYSRDTERQADSLALDMLEAHYGHTMGAGQFFESILELESPPEWGEFLRTHPLTDERLLRIATRQSSLGVQGDSIELRPLPVLLEEWAAPE
jgi:beta-barrel assembly-enhancing protease